MELIGRNDHQMHVIQGNLGDLLKYLWTISFTLEIKNAF